MTTSSRTSPAYKPGDLLKVAVLYSNQQRSKARPAVVVSVEAVQSSRSDIIVVPLSTKAGGYFADRPVRDWKAASLNQPTFIKAIVVTVEQGMIERVWGRLSDYDYQQVRDAIHDVLDI